VPELDESPLLPPQPASGNNHTANGKVFRIDFLPVCFSY
jgi:hypothetical protein